MEYNTNDSVNRTRVLITGILITSMLEKTVSLFARVPRELGIEYCSEKEDFITSSLRL